MPKGQTDSKPIVRSLREVAEAFGVKQRAVAEWKAKGMPFTVNPGHKNFWYNLDDIYDWRLKYESAKTVVRGKSKIPERITEILPQMGELGAKIEEFKLKKADLLAAEQMSSLSIQSRIKKLKLADLDDEALMALTNSEAARWFQLLGVDFAIKYDKEALERSKGVDNISKVLGIINQLKDIDNEVSDG